MVEDVLSEVESGMQKAVDAFQRELAKIRTGRANLALLDGVKVDYYGTPTPLNQVAALNVADARLITIKPWEKNMIPVIEKAIRSSDLGLNPVSDSEMVRLPIPPLTQERRKELVKIIKKMTEDARVAVRAARRDGNEMLKSLQKDGDISEDDLTRGQKKVQELTDKYIAKVDDIGGKKEAELMEV
ncbi:MAG: ribosome recycling factor [Deltaproteobacteria bacterium]|nr:MAG: ribosome recycling factor [Deltaproteobacteria bacterium]